MRTNLDPARLRHELLDGSGPWTDLQVLPEVDSTNAECIRAGRTWGVVIADHQVGGRGRLGRAWQDAPCAGLAMSAVLPVPPPRTVSWLPLVAGLAVAEAVDVVTQAAGQPVHPSLKWPNDVLMLEDDMRKVCGILCEMSSAGVVVGIGINVDQGRDELPVPTATSLRLCGVRGLAREPLAVQVLTNLHRWHSLLSGGDRGLEAVRTAYRDRCGTVGREVEIHRDITSGEPVTRATAVDIDSDGRLVTQSSAGRVALAAGDVVHVRGQAAPGQA